MAYDGSLKFDTAIDTEGYEEGLQEIQKSAEKAADAMKPLADAIVKIEENMSETVVSANNFAESTEDVKKETDTATKSIEKLADETESAKEDTDKLAESLDVLETNLQETATKAVETEKKVSGFGASLKNIEDGANKAANQLKPFSAAAGVVSAGLIASAVSAGKFADDINTMAKVTGISTEELQKFIYASDLIDVSMETMTGSLTKLTRNMNDASQGTGTAKDAFAQLGINVTNADGSLRNSQEVFYQAIDALAGVENATLRDALAMDIFGKSAQELNPLILGGSEDLKALGEQAEKSGLIMSQEALDGANAFNDVLDTLGATATATKNAVGASLGEALIPLAEELSGAIIGLSEWLAQLDGDTLKFILAITGLVAVMTPLLLLVGQVAGGILSLIKLWGVVSGAMAVATAATTATGAAATGTAGAVGLLGKAIALMTNPVFLVIAAIGLLVVAFIDLWKNSEAFREFWIGLWEKIKAAPAKAIADIKADLQQWADIGSAIVDKMFGGIKAGWQKIENWINDKFGWLDDMVNDWGMGGGGTKAQDSRGRVSGSYATGSTYVANDMVAKVHRGEKIVPANQANSDTALLQQVVSELKSLQQTVYNQPYVQRNISRVEGVR